MKQFGGPSSFDAYAAPLPTPPGGRGGGVRERYLIYLIYLIERPHIPHRKPSSKPCHSTNKI